MAERRRGAVTVGRVWARSNVVTLVLILFILLSTLLNALMLGAIYRIREVVRGHLTAAVTQVSEARRQKVHYDFPINQSFPISTTIQLNETLDVPIDLTVPIQQSISVPVEVPLVGRVELPVELDFDVPISTTVTVAVDKQIPISTAVDLNTDIPLEIDLGQPPLGNVLERLEETLRELLDQM
ncbi:MAG TPA: hypothetical protein VLA19_23550 [Herpetosiphonaceae bacterium]|nr:hypothetical protein [Herpetosiphonaceae bacterium]